MVVSDIIIIYFSRQFISGMGSVGIFREYPTYSDSGLDRYIMIINGALNTSSPMLTEEQSTIDVLQGLYRK